MLTTCQICGKVKNLAPSRIRHGRGHFCSRHCAGIWKAQVYKGRKGIQHFGETNPNWKGIRKPKLCPICGDIFISANKTCSIECGHKLQRIKIRKSGNGQWRDENTWLLYHYRDIVLKANSRCEKCGRMKNLLVHHKDGNRRNNTITNLSVLCPSCHHAIHSEFIFSLN